MKKIVIALLILSSLVPLDAQVIKDSNYYRQKGYQVFPELGFAINASVELEDISKIADGDFTLNYAGIESANTSQQCFYQLIVSSLPVGYKDYTDTEARDIAMKIITNTTESLRNVKKIYFSEYGYSGICGECMHNNIKQKGVYFYRDGHIYAMTVISNYNLESRYNSFTNSIKFFSKENPLNNPQNSNYALSTAQSAYINTYISEIRSYISAPVSLKKEYNADVDYEYVGLINRADKDNEILFKVVINKLPMKLSQMGSYDRETIKSNIKNYAYSKSSCQTHKPKINYTLAYSTTSKDYGYNVNECVILTDSETITLIVASKKDVSQYYSMFINSLTK